MVDENLLDQLTKTIQLKNTDLKTALISHSPLLVARTHDTQMATAVALVTGVVVFAPAALWSWQLSAEISVNLSRLAVDQWRNVLPLIHG